MNPPFSRLIKAIAKDRNYQRFELPHGGAQPDLQWMENALERAVNGSLSPYIGMGNPSADVLLIGREKALDLNRPGYWPIIQHELLMNYAHWHDIVQYHSHTPSHDPALLHRRDPFTGFSPYNPLLFPATWDIVARGGGHTYRRMWLSVNCGTGREHMPRLTALAPAAREAWTWNLFDKVFISELNMKVARSSSQTSFRLRDWLSGPRYTFMAGIAAPFYTRFKTVVIYAGVNKTDYVGAQGTSERLELVRIFNPSLNHCDMHPLAPMGQHVEEYANGTGARVLITPSLFMHVGIASALAIQHLLCTPSGQPASVSL